MSSQALPHYEPDYGPSHVLHCGPRYRSSYAAMHAGSTTATATAPLDRQMYTAGYIHMEIEAMHPWCAGSNDPAGIGRGLLKSATPLD